MMIKFTVRCQQKRQSQKVQERKNKVSQPQKSLNLTEIIEILKEPKSQKGCGHRGVKGVKGAPKKYTQNVFYHFLAMLLLRIFVRRFGFFFDTNQLIASQPSKIRKTKN